MNLAEEYHLIVEFESDKVIDSAVKPFINSLSKHGENL